MSNVDNYRYLNHSFDFEFTRVFHHSERKRNIIAKKTIKPQSIIAGEAVLNSAWAGGKYIIVINIESETASAKINHLLEKIFILNIGSELLAEKALIIWQSTIVA